MEAALQALLPKLLTRATFRIHPHQGKPDLLRQLPMRLRGYASWISATWRIVVVIDRDEQDCEELKARLERMAGDAGLTTRSAARGSGGYVVVNRVAVAELEAWYFGDWEPFALHIREQMLESTARLPIAGPTRSRAARTRHCSGCCKGVDTSATVFARSRPPVRSRRTWCHRAIPPRASAAFVMLCSISSRSPARADRRACVRERRAVRRGGGGRGSGGAGARRRRPRRGVGRCGSWRRGPRTTTRRTRP